MDIHIKNDGNSWFLYDSAVFDDNIAGFFDPGIITDRGLVTGHAAGRGEALFFSYNGHDLVLRHFRRGGVIGKFFTDQYLGWNPEESRSWREWRLLQRLYAAGLPVPRPAAARVQFHQGFYRADLITWRIPGVPLALRLKAGPLSHQEWRRIGMTIAHFHHNGAYHADLNASNILIDTAGDVFLIDFDRGDIRQPGRWLQGNLDRLLRSLCKFKATMSVFHFAETNWETLLVGYHESARTNLFGEKDMLRSA